MAIEFNRYIRGKTLDLHELDNVDTTELLDFIKQKMEIKVLNLGRNSINDEYEKKPWSLSIFNIWRFLSLKHCNLAAFKCN